jgi:membrane-associated protease RseP (regulator of RpoE activity)
MMSPGLDTLRRVSGLLAISSASLLSACGGSTTTSGSTTDCSVAGENAQVFSTMQSWYYWYQSLPASVNPASYGSPSALLDAIRQQPLDRFSFITTQAADQSFYAAGQYVGYGLGFDLTASNELQVTRVFPGSPAAAAGLARGDTVTAINGTPVPTLIANNQLDAALAAANPGVTVTFVYEDLELQTHTVTLTSAVVTEPSVAQVNLLAVAGERVGYIVFNSFITPSTSELDQAFTQLVSQGATNLVVDERYNGGGQVSVAQHLASLIAGNGYAGKVLGTLTYNSLHSDQNTSVSFESVTNPLNLTEVYFITTNATASASEFVINALKPYIHVVTAGSTTFGKPVGEDGFNICTDVLYPITFKIVNAAGSGDYFDGLPPTCPAIDDLAHGLGDPDEASLATALSHITTGSCGPNVAAAARESALREAAHPRQRARYDWRRLVNAY